MPSRDPLLIFDFADAFGADSFSQRIAFSQPVRIVTAQTLAEILPALQDVSAAIEKGFYAAGFVSYEAAPAFDAALFTHEAGDLPLLWFGIFSSLAKLPVNADNSFAIGKWETKTSRETYDSNIATIREAIRHGDTYQVNYTIRLSATFSGDSLAWYGHMHHQAHGAFNAYLDIGRHQILSLSPELFFAWDRTTLITKPMKGTARRGDSKNEKTIIDQLLSSEKNKAENVMIVDLLRNDLAKIATTGSVKVPHLLTLESYSTLYQLTSTITAQTQPNINLVDIFRALFPCGSVTGAPKIKSTEIIAALEGSPRGVYCGAVGFITPQGKAIFNVPIRTVVIDSENSIAECGVGSGIVWDSNSEEEYAETMTKALFLKTPLFQFELLETLRLQEEAYMFLEQHLQRIKNSATHFGFSFLREKIELALEQHRLRHSNAIHRVRLLVAINGDVKIESSTLNATVVEWSLPLNDVIAMDVAIADEPVNRNDPFLYHKTTERSVYDDHFKKYSDLFDVLLWNQDDELTEFTRGNLVIDIAGKLLTPPVKSGLLAGVLRNELLRNNVITEAILHRDDLKQANAVWFINSVRGWVKVLIKNN